MNKNLAIPLIVVAVVAFLLGRWSGESSQAVQANSQNGQTADSSMNGPERRRTKDLGDLERGAREAAATGRDLTEEQAKVLTSEERLELIRKGALIFDGLKQEKFVINVIKTLDEDELAKAIKIFGKAQDRGNWPAQGIWDELWKQSGRLNPTKTLSSLKENHTRSDARFIMEGWCEVDPVAAMTWARSPKDSFHEAAAAAYALTRDADGNPEKLLESLSGLGSSNLVLKDCLQDYFDLADISGTSEGTTAIYEKLPKSLKPQAWAVTMRRLAYTDAQEAIDWLGDHVGDAGADYSQTGRLFRELALDDPSGITKWAADLPTLKEGETHPVEMTFRYWRASDRAAAYAWLDTVEGSPVWRSRLARKF